MLKSFLPTRVLFFVLLVSVCIAAYAGLAVWKEQGQYANYADLPSGLEGAISLVIGLLLAFRANRAFERWWEARTLWGTLVNASRNLAVKANNIVRRRDQDNVRFCELICAFSKVLKQHLRNSEAEKELAKVIADASKVAHPPSRLVNEMYGILENWKLQQRIQYGEFRMLDRELKVFLEVCGGCERIRNTPIAASYRVFLNHAIAVFLLTLPWGIVNEFGIWTIPVTFFTSYFIIATEGIAEHIEQPFQGKGDGLDLESICAGIENSVVEIFSTNNDHLQTSATGAS